MLGLGEGGLHLDHADNAIKKVSQIEQFFKESFFAPLKQGCGRLVSGNPIISKYFLRRRLPRVRQKVGMIRVSGTRGLRSGMEVIFCKDMSLWDWEELLFGAFYPSNADFERVQ
jgi:hypothetical protein